MWRSIEAFRDPEGRINIILEHPSAPEARFVLKQNLPQLSPEQHPQTVAEPAPSPEAVPSPVLTGLSDAEFLFPSDLEVTNVNVGKVLLVGSCLTALYHEQLQAMGQALL
ncbi:hypothetical protein AD953_05645, partial [Acetobacter malorum]